MKILSLDPGKNSHFAFALIDSGFCQKTGILWTIDDLTHPDFQKNYTKFGKQIRQLIQSCDLNPENGDIIVAERYMTRPGMNSGNTSEYINIMLGIIAMVALPVPLVIIPSSQWKNYMRATYTIGKETTASKKKSINCRYENILEFLMINYPNSTQTGKKKDWLAVHEADALGIGVYWWEHITGESILMQVWTKMDGNKTKQQIVH